MACKWYYKYPHGPWQTRFPTPGLGQEQTTASQLKQPPPLFVNKVLLAHSHAHLCSIMAAFRLQGEGPDGPQSQKRWLCGPSGRSAAWAREQESVGPEQALGSEVSSTSDSAR